MSAVLVCPICHQHVYCSGDHGTIDISSSPVRDCPPLKGGLHIFVKDDKGKGVEGVTVNSSAGSSYPTDADGLVCYDQLAANTYDTGIELTALRKLSETYYISSKPKFPAPVQQGKITLVVFQVSPIPWIEIKLEDTGSKPIPSNAKIRLKQTGTIDKTFPTDTHNIRADHNDGLKEGEVTLVGVELDKSCEFVDLTTT